MSREEHCEVVIDVAHAVTFQVIDAKSRHVSRLAGYQQPLSSVFELSILNLKTDSARAEH